MEAQKSLILNTKKHVKFCEKPINKEKKADSKNIKPNFNKKSEKINKMTLSITNPDYALLEKQIRQKEKEIEEYEKYLHNHTETNDMSKNKKNLFEDSKNNEKQTKKEFLKKINNKLMQDLPQFEFFGNQSQSDKSEKEADIKESNTFSEKERNKKIDFFLQSSKKNGKIERSPLDHLLLVNNIIERKKDNLSEKPYKNQFSEDFFDFEDFENDIEMYKKLYSEKLEKSIKKKDELEKSSFSSSSEDNYFTVKKLGVNKNKEIIWGSVNKENIQIESNCDFQFADKQFKDYLPINNKFNDILTKDAKELLQRKELNILDL